MIYNAYDDFDDLPAEGPALLHYAPFASLGCTEKTYWLPMSSRKVLCWRAFDQNGVEVFVSQGVPYRDIAQRWLEEALACPGNTVFATSEEIFDRLRQSDEKRAQS